MLSGLALLSILFLKVSPGETAHASTPHSSVILYSHFADPIIVEGAVLPAADPFRDQWVYVFNRSAEEVRDLLERRPLWGSVFAPSSEKIKNLIREPGILRTIHFVPASRHAHMGRPEITRPDLGHRSRMLEFRQSWATRDFQRREYRTRALLHDLDSNSTGYADRWQLQLLDFTFAEDEQLDEFYLYRAMPIEFQWLGPRDFSSRQQAWRADVTYLRERAEPKSERLVDRTTANLGLGGSRRVYNAGLFWFVMFAAGYSTDPEVWAFFGSGPRLGTYWQVTDNLKWTVHWEYLRLWGDKTARDRRTHTSRFNYFLGKNVESHFEFRDSEGIHSWGLGLRLFY